VRLGVLLVLGVLAVAGLHLDPGDQCGVDPEDVRGTLPADQMDVAEDGPARNDVRIPENGLDRRAPDAQRAQQLLEHHDASS